MQPCYRLVVLAVMFCLSAALLGSASAQSRLALSDPRDLVAQGRIFIDENRLDQAEEVFRDAIDAWHGVTPAQPFGLALTHGFLADIYRRQQRTDAAIRHYDIAEQLLASVADRVSGNRRVTLFRHRGRLASDHGLTLMTAGRNAEAEAVYHRSIALKAEVLPDGHFDFAVTFANLGMALFALERDSEAADYFQRAIAIRKPVLGPDRWEVGQLYGYLARIKVRGGEPEAAIPLYEKSVQGLRDHAAYWHPTLLAYYIDLANLTDSLNRAAESAGWVAEQIALRRDFLTEDEDGLAQALLQLGLIRLQMEQPAAAVPILEEALALGDPRTLPKIGYEPGEYLIALARAHEMLGDYDRSIDYSRQAIALAERLYGRDDPRVVPYLQGHGGLLQEAGQFEDVLSLLQRVVDLIELEKGPEHPALIDPLMQLQNATAYLGQYDVSVRAMERAIAIARAHDADNETLATMLNNLGLLYFRLGNIRGAEPYHQEALALARQEHGADSLLYALYLANMAQVYQAYGQFDEAISLGEAALAIREAHPDDPQNIAMSLNNLATAYRLSGHPADPEPMYRRAIDLISQAMSPNHPDVASPMNNLAGHLRNNGRYEEAEELYRQVLAIREAAFGRVHEKYANALNNLGVLYLETDRQNQAVAAFRESISIYEASTGLAFLEAERPLGNLAEVMLRLERYEDALALYQQIAETQAHNLSVNHWDYRHTQSTIAGLYFHLEEFQTALDIYRDLLTFLIEAEGPDGESTIRIAEMVAFLEEKVGQPH